MCSPVRTVRGAQRPAAELRHYVPPSLPARPRSWAASAGGSALDGLRVDERTLPRSLGEALEPLFYALEEAAEGDADALAAYKGNSVYMWRLQRQMPGHSYEQFMAPCVRGAGSAARCCWVRGLPCRRSCGGCRRPSALS
jgi:hypothetical protein